MTIKMRLSKMLLFLSFGPTLEFQVGSPVDPLFEPPADPLLTRPLKIYFYRHFLQRPRPATGVSRALRPRGVPGVSFGVSLGPFAPLALECPKTVPRVSPECQKGVPDTPGTLSGHFLDSPEPGARRAPETPRKTLPGHFGPEGPERLL